MLKPDQKPPPAGAIEVLDPISRRFLFRYWPEDRIVEMRHRGARTEVYLSRLDADPKDPQAIITTNAA